MPGDTLAERRTMDINTQEAMRAHSADPTDETLSTLFQARLREGSEVSALIAELDSVGSARILLECLPSEDAASLSSALYWHCSNYHRGQGSEEYAILSSLDYRPGANESGIDCEDADAVAAYHRLGILAFGTEPEIPFACSRTETKLEHIIQDNARYADRAWVFQFGAYGDTFVGCFGDSLDDALEDCARYLRDNGMDGYFCDPEFEPDADGHISDEEWERATVDLTYTDSGYLASWEWHIQEVFHDGLLRACAERAMESTSWGFMRPDVAEPDALFWEATTEAGEVYLYPSDSFAPDDIREEWDGEIESIEPSIGIHYRLSAPGYQDATEWERMDSWAELYARILEDAWEANGDA